MGEKKLTSRQLQAERTKQSLIEAGVELIKSARYDDISITDITDKCGVSKGTFYVYFDSKDQFFYSICHADYAKLGAFLADEDEPLFLERLRAYCREWIMLNDTMSVYYMQHWFSHMLDDEFHMKVTGTTRSSASFRDDIRACIASAKENGELVADAPIDTLTDYVLIVLYGFDAFGVISKRSNSIAQWAKILSDSIVDNNIGAYRP